MSDPELALVGYQVNFAALLEGLFLFNHSCTNTLAIEAGAFADLHRGPLFAERKLGAPACPDFCVHRNELSPCPAACECAFVREVLQVVRQWPKRNEAESPARC